MIVVFIHGPAASGKYTIASKLSAITGLALFHNHLVVDAALALFPFGTPGFNAMRAAGWRTAFSEAAKAGQSFIFTFHPEASVAPGLIRQMIASVEESGGTVHFIELLCSTQAAVQRIANPGRTRFGKLADPALFLELEKQGAFKFPPLPTPLLKVDTEQLTADAAAEAIAAALKRSSKSK